MPSATSCGRHSISRAFSAPSASALRGIDLVVVLVGLAEVRGVGVRDRAVLAHPEQGGARVEPSRERDADSLADREALQDVGHGTGP